MIIVKLSGGLGNQLFQYALGRQLAVLNQTELKLDVSQLGNSLFGTPRSYALDAFSINASLATNREISELVGASFSMLGRFGAISPFYQREPHFHFSPLILRLRGDLYFDGYWQSERYFKPIASLVKQELKLQNTVLSRFQMWQNLIQTSESVSVHVRRGDYTLLSMANRFLRPCGLDYYQKAASILLPQLQQPTFFVFSDDPVWAKTHLHFPVPTHYVTGNSAAEDLALISQCQHHIIANSTFSWWGAWLAAFPHKKIIAPQQWFATERFNTKDLLPDDWGRV